MEPEGVGHEGGVNSALRDEAVDPPLFDDLYERHVDAVWRLLARAGVPSSDLEDAVQEVFLVAHRKLPEFRGDSQPKTWLFSIGLRVAKDARRRLARKGGTEPLDAHPRLESDQRLEEQTMQRQRFEQLLRLLDALDDDLREVFVLAELEELSAPEIATVTGHNVNTVYSRMRTARLRFAELVSQQEKTP